MGDKVFLVHVSSMASGFSIFLVLRIVSQVLELEKQNATEETFTTSSWKNFRPAQVDFSPASPSLNCPASFHHRLPFLVLAATLGESPEPKNAKGYRAKKQ